MRFWFNTREEAVIFIKKVCDRFDVCGRVSIADVNQLLRILSEESDYPRSKEYDYSRGWSDVSNFKIDTSYCANGCLVAAPDPIKFDSSKETTVYGLFLFKLSDATINSYSKATTSSNLFIATVVE